MSDIIEKLDQLKNAIHPVVKMNIVDQCVIVAEALGYGSPYEGDNEGVCFYLNISPNKVYKMNYIHHAMTPRVKDGFKMTDYQCNKAYEVATWSPEVQLKFLESEEYKKRMINTSTSSKKGDEDNE